MANVDRETQRPPRAAELIYVVEARAKVGGQGGITMEAAPCSAFDDLDKAIAEMGRLGDALHAVYVLRLNKPCDPAVVHAMVRDIKRLGV